MTNAQIIDTLSKRLIARASNLIADLDLTYTQARGRLQAESVAGPAVWSIVDAHFAGDDADEALVAPAPFMWAICICCAGHGRVDNPAFSNGFTSSEWADLDGDERDAYMSGTYDVPCGACRGAGKVQLPDVARMTYPQKRRLAAQRRDERDRALYAAEAAAERRAGC